MIEGKLSEKYNEIGHVSPNFIIKVKSAEFGENSVDSEKENFKKNNKKISKTTQAIDFFYKGKTPQEVLIRIRHYVR